MAPGRNPTILYFVISQVARSRAPRPSMLHIPPAYLRRPSTLCTTPVLFDPRRCVSGRVARLAMSLPPADRAAVPAAPPSPAPEPELGHGQDHGQDHVLEPDVSSRSAARPPRLHRSGVTGFRHSRERFVLRRRWRVSVPLSRPSSASSPRRERC